MINKKKIACASLALVMLLPLFAGCAGTSTEATNSTTLSEGGNTVERSNENADVTSETAVHSYSDGIDDNGLWIGIRALDYVQMFDYHAMNIPAEFHYITDDDVQFEIDAILSEYSDTEQTVDRAVQNGDLVNIDYVGSVDGVEFSGGSTGGMGTDVTAGSMDYIDDFLTQIIGHMPGDTVYVEVTFPEVYTNNPDLQNKEALFVTKINYIIGAVQPELTDDFVSSNMSIYYGWTTVEEMKGEIRAGLQNAAIQQYIHQFFTTEVTIQSIPDQLMEYQEKALLNSCQEYAEYYLGISAEDYIIMYEGFSGIGEFLDASYDDNLANAAFHLVLQAVAEDAGISINDDDMAEYFFKFTGSDDYSSYEEYYGKPYLVQVVLCQRVLDYITENAILL